MSENHASNYVGNKCLVCGGKAEVYSTDNCNHKFVECETCGRFEINTYGQYTTAPKDMDKLASYLYYNGKINQPIKTEQGYFYNFIGMKNRFDKEYSEHPYCYHVTNDIIENWYPKSFSEKVDTLLLGFWKQYQYFGYEIKLTETELYSATFVKRQNDNGSLRDEDQCRSQEFYLLHYLEEQSYIEPITSGSIKLKTGALKRIDELQRNNEQNSKNAFIAMSFAPETKEVRESIRAAVEISGYIPRIMDEIQHNHQIVPEMLYEIKQARFVIAELTSHNNGAYFEAGYALGLGKEVIQVCRKDAFGADGHFDVKQVNTILWENIDELHNALIKRIQATI